MAAPLPIEQQFATAVLRKWGRPVTATSVRNVIGWMRAEGGHTHNKARFNFLNTTQPAPGAGNTGSQGNIKVYPNFQTGVDATVKTLNNGRYGPIAAAVNSDPSTFARAVNSTPWGTKSDFSGISRSLSVSGVSGGAAAADAGAVPPAASASLPQESAGQLDVERLRMLLRNQTKRSLRGIMPAPGFRGELQKLAGQSLPRALAVEGAQSVGTAAAGAAATVVGAAADSSASQVVNAAKQYVGTPYSWGGGSPSGPTRGIEQGANTVGFDCSALVQMAWAKVGVKLPRVTQQQIKVGKAVNGVQNARPGDLLFPSDKHVMMAIGNGQAIEAPFTGGQVRIVSITSRDYIAIRRPA